MTGAERAAGVVAVVAFAMSARALYEYARTAAGFDAATAAGMPIIIDALVLVAGQISLDRHTTGHRSGLAGVVFWTAIAVSVAANYAHAVPAIRPTGLAEAVGGGFAALPPLALAGSYELVVRERRRRASAAAGDHTSLDGHEQRPPTETPAVAPVTVAAATASEPPVATPDREHGRPTRAAATAPEVAEVVAAYLADDADRSVHDGQLTAVVADRLAVSERTARRRLRALRDADSSTGRSVATTADDRAATVGRALAATADAYEVAS